MIPGKRKGGRKNWDLKEGGGGFTSGAGQFPWGLRKRPETKGRDKKQFFDCRVSHEKG